MRAEPQGSTESAKPVPAAGGYVSPVGSRRLEVAFGLAVSMFGGLFALQSFPPMLAQWAYFNSAVGLAMLVLVYGSIAVAILAALLRQWTAQVFLGAAFAYLIALALWPLTIVGDGGGVADFPGDARPWITVLAALGAAFIVVARRDWIVPLLYILVTSSASWLIRVSPYGGGIDVRDASLEWCYTTSLGLAILALVVSGRQAAASVDAAQTHALHRFAMAKIDQATEQQRVRTDALVHDSVLTTLLSAARASDPASCALAATMASNSLAHLGAAGAVVSDNAPVRLDTLLARIERDAGRAVDNVFTMRLSVAAAGVRIPAVVADAIADAAVQAMVNSANHAGAGVSRTLSIDGTEEDGVTVVVVDDGRGFDLDAIPAERLGVRISMIGRVASIGGRTTIVTAPGHGTRVTIRWPKRVCPNAADAQGAAEHEEQLHVHPLQQETRA